MNKEFVPYAEALALKELGFDEPWFSVYEKQKINWLDGTYQNHLNWKDVVSAPLYQQAFRWFREKYGLYPQIEFNAYYQIWLVKLCNVDGTWSAVASKKSYEEAELACLRKLIELANESI